MFSFYFGTFTVKGLIFCIILGIILPIISAGIICLTIDLIAKCYACCKKDAPRDPPQQTNTLAASMLPDNVHSSAIGDHPILIISPSAVEANYSIIKIQNTNDTNQEPKSKDEGQVCRTKNRINCLMS